MDIVFPRWQSHLLVLKEVVQKSYIDDLQMFVFETCWLGNLLLVPHCPLTKTNYYYCDNVNVIYHARNLVQREHTKHIEKDINFVWENLFGVYLSVACPVKVPTSGCIHKGYSIWWFSRHSQHTTILRFDHRRLLVISYHLILCKL